MAKSRSTSAATRTGVVVTTEFRGVFFGYLLEDASPAHVILADARNCIYWSAALKGVLGLAAIGPDEGCRVGPKVPRLCLQKVTSVMNCTAEASKRWEAAPWS